MTDRPVIHICSWEDIPSEFHPLSPEATTPLPQVPPTSRPVLDHLTANFQRHRTANPETGKRRTRSLSPSLWPRMRRNKRDNAELHDAPENPIVDSPVETSGPPRALSPAPSLKEPSNRRHSASSQLVWVDDLKLWFFEEQPPNQAPASGEQAVGSDEIRFRTSEGNDRPLPMFQEATHGLGAWQDHRDVCVSPSTFDPPPVYASEWQQPPVGIRKNYSQTRRQS